MSRQAREVFGRFLEETGLRAKRQSPEAALGEGSADLFLLAQRLRRMRSVRAPARLRSRVLGQAHALPASAPLTRPVIAADVGAADVELAEGLRRLRTVHAPARLRDRALAPSREWQHARRVIPLAEVRESRERWLRLVSRAVAAVGIVFFAGYSAYAVSASPLPGSPFYPVKLFAEDVRITVASPDDRPHIYVEQAEQRIDETQRLIESGQFPEAEKTAQDARRSIESARASAGQSSHPQQAQSAIDDAEVRQQAIARKVADHKTVSSVVAALPPSEPAAVVTSAPAPPPPVTPQAPDAAASTGAGGSSASVAAPVPSSVDLIEGGSAAPRVPTATSGRSSSQASAPSGNGFHEIERGTPAPTRTAPVARAAASTSGGSSPTPAPTATRTAAPAQPSPSATTAAPSPKPAGTSSVAAPGGNFTEIPPR